MSASLTLDKSKLEKLAALFDSPVIKMELERLPQRKAVAAIVAQAIAENFDLEGPGWQPLKPETIRRSVAKKLRKALASLSDEELLAHEARARKEGENPNRRILQKTGLLKKTATIPGFHGSATVGSAKNKKTISGSNIWKTEGSHLIWGTDLIYAGVHNEGYPKRNIPQREFMTIRKQWMEQLTEYLMTEIEKIIDGQLKGAGK